MSREGAFLANNLLFVLFAFVVLLGTVFPLLYEALNSGAQVAVGAPYFNRLIIPIGLGLLFLMAVAPALPWRKSTAEIMRGRLAVPAAIGVAGGGRVRHRGDHRHRAAPGLRPRGLRRRVGGPGPGAVGAGGLADGPRCRCVPGPGRPGRVAWVWSAGPTAGMVVHIGVVVIAVGLAAATAFGQRGDRGARPRGRPARFAGHTVEFVGTRVVRTPSHVSQQALLRVDGGAVFTPAISQFGTGTQAVGTPAIDSSVTSDVYLTINSIPAEGWSLDLRRGRPAPGHVAVGRWGADRGRIDPVGRAGPASPAHRSGVHPGRCGADTGRHREPDPRPLPVGPGAARRHPVGRG